MDKQLLQDLEHLREIRKESAPNPLGLTGINIGGKVYDPVMRTVKGVGWVGNKMLTGGKIVSAIGKKIPGIGPLFGITGAAMGGLWVGMDAMPAWQKARQAGNSVARTSAKEGWQG